ncbi:MAG TPA: YggS family pyridoxal phosphate-dependent enzyme [Firmicutes bacterium]|nr:YggS family pyridoxal phosphate-dependent enzyme [Bacillota bacterium]
MSLEDNLVRVRQRIAEACKRAGRPIEAVKLVAVTKNVSPDRILEAAGLGVTYFGENRVQEAKKKISVLGDKAQGLRFHMIGHLQRNKVAPALRMFELIHSVDSLRLLQAIERKSDELGITAKILLQVNVSGESTKSGFSPQELNSVLEVATGLRHIQVMGLMTIAPYTENPETVRPYFAQLRELTEIDPSVLRELSMGMSGDFEVAIEEGATMVRIGTAIFGSRCYTREENSIGMDSSAG